jgi:hypothetical protein
VSEAGFLRASISAGPWCRRVGYFARAALLGLALSLLSPVGAVAAVPGMAGPAAAAQSVQPRDNSRPGAGELSAPARHHGVGERLAAAGLVLILLGGLSGVTIAMWRDLGRRMGGA